MDPVAWQLIQYLGTLKTQIWMKPTRFGNTTTGGNPWDPDLSVGIPREMLVLDSKGRTPSLWKKSSGECGEETSGGRCTGKRLLKKRAHIEEALKEDWENSWMRLKGKLRNSCRTLENSRKRD